MKNSKLNKTELQRINDEIKKAKEDSDEDIDKSEVASTLATSLAFYSGDTDESEVESTLATSLAFNSGDTDEIMENAEEIMENVTDLAMMFVPQQHKQACKEAIESVALKVFEQVMGFSTGVVKDLGASAASLAKLQAAIDELQNKVDRLLCEPMENAVYNIKQAATYLENKETFDAAYREYDDALTNANKAFRYVGEFDKKIMAKRLAVYARIMRDSYSREAGEFIPLTSMKPSLKHTISKCIKVDIDETLEEQSKQTISWGRWLTGRGEKQVQRTQDTIDGLMKLSLPLLWHVLPEKIIQDPNAVSLLPYVPEGLTDAATVALDEDVTVLVWKDKEDDGSFKLRWSTGASNVSTVDRKGIHVLNKLNFMIEEKFSEQKEKLEQGLAIQ